MKINGENGKIVLRISLSLVFLWFGINQIYSPTSWTGFVPPFVSSIISPGTVVLMNGSLEIILGLFLISGLYVRFSSLVLAVHLFAIALPMGYNAIAIRDFGLAFATLAIFFNGADKFCLDYKNKDTNI
ncbi:MAG: DoxX family membrane protein [Nanoarchaeota archaeon]|nr:DoxX family membrane protein [Nanoarchaeota archaeon]